MTNTKEINTEKKKNYIKTILQSVFFTSLAVVAILYIVLNNPDPAKTFSNISQIKVFPFLTTLIVVFVLSVFDGLCIFILARQYDGKYQIVSGVNNALTSNFVGVFNKTAATVIQTSTLTKQGIKVSKAFSITTMYFFIYQFTLVLYGGVSFAFSYPVVKGIEVDIIPGLEISVLSLIGLSINTGILILILLFAFSKRLHRFILTSFVDLFAKMHIIKNPEEKRNKLATKFITYHVECARLFRQKKATLICVLIFFIRFTINNFIPYLTFWILDVYKYQNLNIDFYRIFCGSNFLSLISVYIPTGAPEIAFQTIFSQLLNNSPEANLVAASGTIVWRLLTFIIPFFVGAILYISHRSSRKNDEKEVISNTMTIYDLQREVIKEESKNDSLIKEYVENLEHSVNKSQKRNLSLLNQEQVNESFTKLKEQIKSISEIDYSNISDKNIEEQRTILKKIIQETDDIIKKNKEFDNEILKEKENEEKHRSKYLARKKRKNEERQTKKIEKDKKKLFKQTGKNTKIIYDDENGIIIDGPKTFEIRTKQTKINSDEEKTNNK